MWNTCFWSTKNDTVFWEFYVVSNASLYVLLESSFPADRNQVAV